MDKGIQQGARVGGQTISIVGVSISGCNKIKGLTGCRKAFGKGTPNCETCKLNGQKSMMTEVFGRKKLIQQEAQPTAPQ